MKNRVKHIKLISLVLVVSALGFQSCSIPALTVKNENKTVSSSYHGSEDTLNSGTIKWRDYFKDQNLIALIDTALKNNQELNIVLQEINMEQNEIMAKKGDYLPFLSVNGGLGTEKVGRYTSQGANDANTEIEPEKEFPEPLSDFMLSGNFSWEIDIWKKLRNAKQSAVYRYLSSLEGKNFITTKLVSEIAESYFELLALDNQLEIVKQNIEIQQNSLKIVKMQKDAAKVTELAVKKFEAEVFKSQSLQYYIEQQIVETENRINFLVGRSPEPIVRNSVNFIDLVPDTIYSGVPSQLLVNRPDIRQSELQLAAAKLDVKSARANFYPSVRITAGVGLQAFNPAHFVQFPESVMYSVAGELVAPMLNRKAIKANYLNANAKQIQAVYQYERTILVAYIEVLNELSNISNLKKSYNYKSQQVDALIESITISTRLFKSARADYMEVLMTQRDVLEARIELIDTKMEQMHAVINIYQALGGGWN